ncbi:MAG: nicotinamide-nucleotide amidase [Bacteriovoracaceae bacterium]|jgi:nicotinamide-nucleotide amidase
MKVDLIIIGNELLNGKIQDLNTHFLAKELHKNGHTLRKVHIIADHKNDFNEAIETALSKADVIITSGGLGPTKDDLTKTMLAAHFNKEIKFNQEAYDITISQYQRGKREYNKEASHYHNLPNDFKAIYNPSGYAPGLYFQINDKKIFATPGVPTEFQSMFTEEIEPKYIEKNDILMKHIIIKTWKLPEAKIFHTIAQGLWEKLEEFGEVSSLPHRLGVDIGVQISANSNEELLEKEKKVLCIFNQSPLKDFIWHIGPELLEELIVKKAKEKGLTIGFAESCTGGLCASRITDVSGSSSVFWGSIVSYANEVKQKSLNVQQETLKIHGAVSEETALEMAIGAREQLEVDIAITTTGIAGPGGGSDLKPVGTVGIGVSTKYKSSSELLYFNGDRKALKHTFSQAALFKLLETIVSYQDK